MAFTSPPPSPIIAMFEQLLPLFAIAAVLGILARSAPRRRRISGGQPRLQLKLVASRVPFHFDGIREAERQNFSHKKLFNSSEQKILRVLRDEVAKSGSALHVLGQVHLAEIITTDPKAKPGGNYYVIGSKRVDFLLIDDRSNPVLAVEYHGAGHNGRDAVKNDKIKSIVLKKAGIPLLVINENEPESEIRAAIRAKTGSRVA
jgi:hypothetical protein